MLAEVNTRSLAARCQPVRVPTAVHEVWSLGSEGNSHTSSDLILRLVCLLDCFLPPPQESQRPCSSYFLGVANACRE